MSDDQLDTDQVDRIQNRIAAAREQVKRRLVGQEQVMDQVLAVMLAALVGFAYKSLTGDGIEWPDDDPPPDGWGELSADRGKR